MIRFAGTALMLMLVGWPIGWLLAELAKWQPHLGVLMSLSVGILCGLLRHSQQEKQS